MNIRTLLMPLLCAGITAQAQFSPIRFVEATELNRIEFGLLHDFDGDGDTDMAMCSEEGAGWWHNNGQGAYAPFEWVHHLPYGEYAELLAAGDVDDDGDIDLVSAINYSTLYCYANDGSGQFDLLDSVSLQGADIRDLLLEDLNDDGRADIIYGDYWLDQVVYLPSLGGGQFGAAQVISTGTGSVMDLHVDDMGGDGDPDVFFCSYDSPGVHICENQGGGAFFNAELLIPATGDLNEVNTADMDGDGDLDIVVAAYGRSLWYPNDGNGVFDLSDTIMETPGQECYFNAIADIDGDGDLDIAPSEYDEHRQSWYANDGAGNFTLVGLFTEAFTFKPAFADIDGDGDQDLVQVNRNAFWWPNDGAGNMGVGSTICATFRNLESVDLADIDGDGDLDAIAVAAMDARTVMYRNNGDGQIAEEQIVLVDTIAYPNDAITGDIDGDGDVDLLIQTDMRIHAFLNDGSGGMAFGQTIVGDAGTVKGIRLGDMDGDGDLDLVEAEYDPSRIRLWRNAGGTFGSPSTISSVFNPASCDVLDADGDGDLDVASYYGQSSGHFIWFENDGSGAFGSALEVQTTTSVGSQCTAVAADVDADGLMDQIYASSQGINIFRGLGGSAFAPAQPIDELYCDESDLYAVDLDSDGDPDIALSDKGGQPARYYLNDGSGTFSAAITFDATWLGDQASELSIGDLDGDGDPDALFGNMNGHGFYAVGMVENYFNSPYHIDGTLFHDMNENGAQDPGEGPLPFVPVHSDPIASTPLTDPDGSYSILTDPGDYAVSVTFPNSWWGLTTSPSTYNVQLTTGTPVSTGNDFGYSPIVDTTVVELGVAANLGACGDTTLIYLTATNVGTSLPSGAFCGMVDTLFTIVSFDPPPASVNGNIYCWEIDSLYYYMPFTIVAEVVVPDASYMGTLLVGGVQLTETDGQGNVLQTFQEAWAAPLTCSYDPNYKEVEPAGYGEAGVVDITTDRVEYTIHFQNTGTAPAQDVVLVDRLSESIDASSLQVLAYSHAPTSVNLETDRDLVMRFNGIQLPDSGTTFTGSQGFIRFAANLIPGLPHGTVIENTADIHFDLNEPVITNTVTTTLVDCDLADAAITPSGWQALQATEGDAYQWSLNDEPIVSATGPLLFFNENGSYTCEVTTVFGCHVTTDPFEVTTTAVSEAKGLRLALMPNPMSYTARLVFSEALLPGDRVELMDVRGNKVMRIASDSSTSVVIDRGALPNGVYLVHVVRGGATFATLRMAVAD